METDMDVELRLAEVKALVELGNMQNAGANALLIQGAANDRERLAEHQEAVKAALSQVAADRKADQEAQARKDEDQERRLRLVDPLPAQMQALATAHQELAGLVGRIATQQNKWAGGSVVGALIVSALVGFILNRH